MECDFDAILDDFTPDIDLLDDLLYSSDWKDLHPSLAQFPHISPIQQEQSQNLMQFPQPSSPLSPSQQQTFVEQKLFPQQQFIPCTSPITTVPQLIQPSPSPPSSSQTQTHAQLILPLQQQQQPQAQMPGTSPQFPDKFCPILPANKLILQQSGGFFPTTNGQTIILPQLQLVLAGSGSSEDHSKLPVKRLSEEKQSSRRSKAKESTSRKSSHNAIERRYRSSINDKILELKNLVCGTKDCSDKVHKAAILRNSIDTIHRLQSSNNRLEKENRNLRSIVNQRKCHNCNTDLFLSNATDLRELLTDSSPPPTDSSNPGTPESGISNSSTGNEENRDKRGSPIALFAIAAGLFLINPGSHHGSHSNLTHNVEEPHAAHSWGPRLFAIIINLLAFLFIYKISGKWFFSSTEKKAHACESDKVREKIEDKFTKALKKNGKDKIESLEEIIFEATGEKMPSNGLLLREYILLSTTLFLNRTYVGEVYDVIAKCYVELGLVNERLRFYCGLKAYEYAQTTKPRIAAVLLTKSKILLKLLLRKREQHFFLQEGLDFFKKSYNRLNQTATTSFLVTSTNDHDPVVDLLGGYKQRMLRKGIEQLYQSGEGASSFQAAMKGVVAERPLPTDTRCQWWASLMWVQAEWIKKGGRDEVLERLYKMIDNLWKQQEHSEDALSRATYFVHLAKRILQQDNGSTAINQVLRLITSAGDNLRDAIAVTSDRDMTMELVWALVSEWILECRVELWLRLEKVDVEFARLFSKDLDTLRGLTHSVETSLPSLYLYEASLRLMTKASPGRTQQLLDASLRNVRSTRSSAICTQDKNTRRRFDNNVINQRRKAMALYLRCKHLPSNVLILGEKAGMLREAIKTLEKIGDRKRCEECLDMIKMLV